MPSLTNMVKATAWLLIAAGALNGVASQPQTNTNIVPASGNDGSANDVTIAAAVSSSNDNTKSSNESTTGNSGSNTTLILSCGGAAVGAALIVAGFIQHRRVQNRKLADQKPSAESARELDMMTTHGHAEKFHGPSLTIPADTMIDITPPKSPRRSVSRDDAKPEHNWLARVFTGNASLSPSAARYMSKDRGTGPQFNRDVYPPEEEFDDAASISSTGYDQGSTSHLAVQISPRVMRVPAAAKFDKDGFDDAMVQAPGLPNFNTGSIYGGNAADWAASVNAAGQELANNYGRTSPLPVINRSRNNRSPAAAVAMDLPNWTDDDAHATDTTVVSPKAILGRSAYVRNNHNGSQSAINMHSMNVDDYIDDEEDDDEDDDIYDSCSDSDGNSIIIDVDQAIEAALPPTRRRRRSSAMSKMAANAAASSAAASGKPPVPPRRVVRLASAPSATVSIANPTSKFNDTHESSWRQQQWNLPQMNHHQLNETGEAEEENDDNISLPSDENTYRVW
ncbi:hypothetical protein BDF22DRAFT_739206 [Syncephalis plumigaleata]|nr:hypothetical protein BDF22DRAFT_739206 [Syncephalis plumigaleata]